MTASERRRAILELLCVRKFETSANLAAEFGVSIRTIGYDIERLSLDYPIYTTTGTYGGVRIMEGFRMRKKFLSEEQSAFLKELIPTLSGDKKSMAESVLNDFYMPQKRR